METENREEEAGLPGQGLALPSLSRSSAAPCWPGIRSGREERPQPYRSPGWSPSAPLGEERQGLAHPGPVPPLLSPPPRLPRAPPHPQTPPREMCLPVQGSPEAGWNELAIGKTARRGDWNEVGHEPRAGRTHGRGAGFPVPSGAWGVGQARSSLLADIHPLAHLLSASRLPLPRQPARAWRQGRGPGGRGSCGSRGLSPGDGGRAPDGSPLALGLGCPGKSPLARSLCGKPQGTPNSGPVRKLSTGRGREPEPWGNHLTSLPAPKTWSKARARARPLLTPESSSHCSCPQSSPSSEPARQPPWAGAVAGPASPEPKGTAALGLPLSTCQGHSLVQGILGRVCACALALAKRGPRSSRRGELNRLPQSGKSLQDSGAWVLVSRREAQPGPEAGTGRVGSGRARPLPWPSLTSSSKKANSEGFLALAPRGLPVPGGVLGHSLESWQARTWFLAVIPLVQGGGGETEAGESAEGDPAQWRLIAGVTARKGRPLATAHLAARRPGGPRRARAGQHRPSPRPPPLIGICPGVDPARAPSGDRGEQRPPSASSPFRPPPGPPHRKTAVSPPARRPPAPVCLGLGPPSPQQVARDAPREPGKPEPARGEGPGGRARPGRRCGPAAHPAARPAPARAPAAGPPCSESPFAGKMVFIPGLGAGVHARVALRPRGLGRGVCGEGGATVPFPGV
ncbi:basic proline-rich protein-like [Lepus europaeus]|uniref:basic proline-rich protein-like n=1 Tax=Lepus europaeus TaxID=9983 RepID=UPI002B494FDD|nr:basic proline-rich protein-like [Lepus europaeus]